MIKISLSQPHKCKGCKLLLSFSFSMTIRILYLTNWWGQIVLTHTITVTLASKSCLRVYLFYSCVWLGEGWRLLWSDACRQGATEMFSGATDKQKEPFGTRAFPAPPDQCGSSDSSWEESEKTMEEKLPMSALEETLVPVFQCGKPSTCPWHVVKEE